MVMKQLKLNILRLLLNKIYLIKANKCCFLTASEGINVGMHLDIYELIWFKLGVMIDITELYTLILVCVTLTLDLV